MLIDRVFRNEEQNQDKQIGRKDLEATEKEISIDIAELRRDIQSIRADIRSELDHNCGGRRNSQCHGSVKDEQARRTNDSNNTIGQKGSNQTPTRKLRHRKRGLGRIFGLGTSYMKDILDKELSDASDTVGEHSVNDEDGEPDSGAKSHKDKHENEQEDG